ncbi:hypothetical protein C8R44DRAFT_862485 [Mycena epipterygia]|nr:hypothetical protein C8R44DRAFT_862485 [Mycena epipterygia]
MDLPQELIDSIIGAIVDGVDLAQDPWVIDNTPDVLETLRSCALVARAFVHPCQTYIFHGITISEDAHIPPYIFSALLAVRPHLACHVRAIYFEYSLTAVAEHLEPIAQILASVVNLARIDIYPDPTSQGVLWQTYPEALSASFLQAFALPYLRHITLWYFHFEDALELQALLAESTGLKTLVLRSITFGDTSVLDERPEPHPTTAPQVVLDSLQLYFLDAAQVQAMLDSFTVIDITRLRSLYLHNTPMNSLVRVNASSIERIRIRAYYPDVFLDETVDPDTLAGADHLQSLDLSMPFLTSLCKMVRIFGSLAHLTRLETISVAVSQKTGPVEWKELDELLGVPGDLPALAKVNVFSHSQWNLEEPHSEALLKAWMPALAGRNLEFVTQLSADSSNTVFALNQIAASAVENKTGGTLEYLINNVAIHDNSKTTLDTFPTTEALENDLLKYFHVNTLGTINTTNAFLPLLRARTTKKVITLATCVADPDFISTTGSAGQVGYTIHKAALNMAVAKFAVALKAEGSVFLALVTRTEQEREEYKVHGQTFAKVTPGFAGSLTPRASVTMMLDVIYRWAVENTGVFVPSSGCDELRSYSRQQDWF